METIARARFQGYLFARLPDDEHIHSALICPGVYERVHFGSEMAQLSDTELTEIRAMVDAGKFPEASSEVFKPGYVVQVSDGPLCGLTGVVVKVKNTRRVLVDILMMLNRTVPTEIDPQRLKVLKRS